MNVAVALVVVVASASLAITALLLVRRNAPDGSYFNDGDRAAGVFGVLATGFAVLLGLVVVLAFTSYDEARTGAGTEALTVAQQYEVAHLLPPVTGRRLAAELIVLRPLRRPSGVAADAGRYPDRRDEPVGRCPAAHSASRRSTHGVRAGRLLEVARPAPRPRDRPQRENPWRDRRHPGAALARPLRHRRDDRRLHVVVRRQRGARVRAGRADRHRRRRDDRRHCW